MGATTFRCQCRLCSDIFFGPDRDMPYCNRCARRIGYRPPKAARPANPPSPAPSASAPPAALPSTSDVEPGHPASDNRGGKTAAPRRRSVPSDARAVSQGAPGHREIKPAGPKEGLASRKGKDQSGDKRTAPPRTGRAEDSPQSVSESRDPEVMAQEPRISESIRTSVEHAYVYYSAEESCQLKPIIDRICTEFGLERRVVHSIVAPIHGAQMRQRSFQLTPDQRKEVVARYEEMVLAGARPSGGRRRQIAHEFGITRASVISVTGQWAWRHHDPREMSRDEKFRIEKAYWRYLHDRLAPVELEDEPGQRPSLYNVATDLAGELNMHFLAIIRWIDQLHDDLRPLSRTRPLSGATHQALMDAYEEYLAGETVPVESLHHALAARCACGVRQAHRAVLLFRWHERVRFLASTDEERSMVAEAAQGSIISA